MSYNDESIQHLKQLKSEGLSWDEIRDKWNNKFADKQGKKSKAALEKAYREYKDHNFSDDVLLKNLKTAHSARKASSKLRKENKILLDNHLLLDDVDEAVKQILESKELKNYKFKEVKSPNKKLTKMTIEALISDIHYGLETKSYNADIARERIKRYAKVLIDEKNRYSKNYDVEMFQILLNGDLIQSATMHQDSGKSCHLTNAQQLAVATESLFFDLILPIARERKKVKVIGTGGNHDREGTKRHTVDPGTSYYTYSIYKALENLCKASGLSNIEFVIPESAYYVYELYGSYFVVEHGDLLANNSSKTIESHLMSRSAQSDKILQGIRFGHYHTDKIESVGRIIGNGSTVSDDHYSDGLGYVGRPCQVINYYVKTNNRATSYYHSFVVDLE